MKYSILVGLDTGDIVESLQEFDEVDEARVFANALESHSGDALWTCVVESGMSGHMRIPLEDYRETASDTIIADALEMLLAESNGSASSTFIKTSQIPDPELFTIRHIDTMMAYDLDNRVEEMTESPSPDPYKIMRRLWRN